MKYSHRFFLYAPVAVLLALAIAAGVYWNIAANAFSNRLDALNGREVMPGVSFRFASKSIGGFPFRVDAVLKDLRVDVATAHGPASWRTENFALHMLDYGGVQVVFEAAGKQVVVWHDRKGVPHGIEFVPGLLRASAIAGHSELQRFDLELIGAAAAPLSVARTELHLRKDPGSDALDLAFMADDVHLAPALETALGDVIARLRLKATLAPAGGWNALLSGRSDWRKAAEGWRAHSGALDIAGLEIAWGKAAASGSGLLTLDAARRPKGILDLKISGYQALANQAARQPLIEGAQRDVLAALIAEAAAKGGGPAGRLAMRLAFKDGLAYVDQTPAGFVAPLY